MFLYFFLALLAPVSIAQIDSIEYSIEVGGEVGIIEYAIESICLTAVGGMTPPDFPFQFDVMLGFGEMYVGRNLWYDNLSPHNFFLLSRVGASTYFVNGSRIYAALTLVKPLKSEVIFTDWGKHGVAYYTTGTILHALCYEFGLRARIAMFRSNCGIARLSTIPSRRGPMSSGASSNGRWVSRTYSTTEPDGSSALRIMRA